MKTMLFTLLFLVSCGFETTNDLTTLKGTHTECRTHTASPLIRQLDAELLLYTAWQEINGEAWVSRRYKHSYLNLAKDTALSRWAITVIALIEGDSTLPFSNCMVVGVEMDNNTKLMDAEAMHVDSEQLIAAITRGRAVKFENGLSFENMTVLFSGEGNGRFSPAKHYLAGNNAWFGARLALQCNETDAGAE